MIFYAGATTRICIKNGGKKAFFLKENRHKMARKKSKGTPLIKPLRETKSLAEQEAAIQADRDGIAYPQFKGLGLTMKQQNFVLAYVRPDVGFNATRAYIEAYDLDESDRLTAHAAGSRLLRNVKVQQAVSIEIARLAHDHDRVAKAIMEAWVSTAFADFFEYADIQGPFLVLKSHEDIPPHMRPHIQSIEQTAIGLKIRLCDKDKARENLAKAMGLFAEDHKQPGEKYETLVQRLAREQKEKTNAIHAGKADE